MPSADENREWQLIVQNLIYGKGTINCFGKQVVMAKKRGKPVVAVVGRPNVGKSTLFNVLAGERISIVKDTPGITRDRIYADAEWLNRKFTLVDTGGI